MSPAVPRPSHREAKKEECRRTIVLAAIRLFETKGFDATTMDEIAVAAHVSRPTVFNYFAHKTDILATLGQMLVDRLMAGFAPVESDVSPVEQLRSALVRMAIAFAEYPETARAFHVRRMQQMHQTNWRQPPQPEPGMQELMEHLAALVRSAQERGEIRADFGAEEILRHLMIGLFASILGPWLNGLYGAAPLASLVERHFDLLRDGFRAR